MSFVHLHVHTEYSLLDGASRISRLPKTCRNLGMDAIAITDHGNMYGVYKFYKAIKEYNKDASARGEKPFKGIIGCEVYVVEDLTTRNFTEHIGHLVLLCKNNTGYLNLCKINSKAWIDGFYKKPRVDYDFLAQHSEGLICLSGCLAGHINYFLMRNMPDEARRYAKRLHEIFGEDFYIELQNQGLEEQKQTNPKLAEIAAEFGIPLVATNDVHYLGRDDAEMQEALVRVVTKTPISEKCDMLMGTDEFYLKSPDEMKRALSNYPEAIANTVKIAEKCDCQPFGKGDLLPEFKVPNGEDKNAYFRRKIEEGLKRCYGDPIPKNVMERYETEFKVIASQGFVDYFLIVADFMEYANNQKIAVGPGRGSAAGSIITYAMGITKLDPLKYDLLFERFLHGERVSMPDIDLDFCSIRRNEVIDYVIKKYGADHVCQIVTFGTLAARAAIKDIARVYEMVYQDVEKITKPIEINQQIKPPYLPYIFDIKKIEKPPEDAGEKAISDYNKEVTKLRDLKIPELVSLYNNDTNVKKIVDMAMKVEGFPRNCSTHAAGVVICKEIVGDVTPLQKNGEDITTQFDMKEVEEIGMLKMDFLGIITLTDIQRTLDDIKKYLGEDVDLYSFEYDDQDVYKMIAEGDTDAVFQLESAGYKRFMAQLKPDRFEDIIAAMALFRPGPMDMIPDYCRFKHNPALTKYDHEMLEPILKATYGQIVYQEQVMDVFRKMGGYSLGQADMVRRAMGKKDPKEMEKQKDVFIGGDKSKNISGAVANGVELKTAKMVFEKMEKFAGYAFNKSHAASYAYLAYQTAYLKYYYYSYYMANVLNNRTNKWDDMTRYINSIRKKGVDVLLPDINRSDVLFTVEDTDGKHNIRFGLSAIKNVGEQVTEYIISERNANGPYRDFNDFCNRVDGSVLEKSCLESLILGGAFDSLGHTRSSIMQVYPTIVKMIRGEKKVTDTGQISLFSMIKEQVTVEMPNAKEFDNELKLKLEKSAVGIYLSGHPLKEYMDLFEQYPFNTSKIVEKTEDEVIADDDSASEFGNDSRVIFGAIISDVKKIVTKAAKKEMAKLRVEDIYGGVDVMVFPATYEKTKDILQKDCVVKITGRLSIREGEAPTILASDMELIKGAISTDTKKDVNPAGPKLYIKYNTRDESVDTDVQNILRGYSGDIPVTVRCSATGDAFLMNINVRECMAIKYELENLLGSENFLFKS